MVYGAFTECLSGSHNEGSFGYEAETEETENETCLSVCLCNDTNQQIISINHLRMH